MKNQIQKIRVLFITLSLLCVINSPSQELLTTNADLETTQLPVHYRQSATWFQPTFATDWQRGNLGTPDVFTDNYSACGSINDPSANPANSVCYPEACVTDNNFGQQYPRTHTIALDGNTNPNHNYVMLFMPSEYLQRHLAVPLVQGSCYTLSFWVSRADRDNVALPMQVAFSTTDMNNSSSAPIVPAANVLVLTDHHEVRNKTGWTKVVFNFKALGGETYMTIGNFDGSFAVSDPTTPGDCLTCGSSTCAGTGLFNSWVYFIDDLSLKPAGENFTVNHSFTNTTITSVNNYSNSNILITGNVTVSGSVTWTNCTVRCNNGATITVPAGSTFSLSNTSLSAGCDLMWKGIIVNGSGKIVMNQSSIEDAITGITFNQGQWQITGTSTTNSYFRRNATDIVMNGSSTGTSNFLRATTFDHTAPLRDPTQTTNGFGTTGIVFNAQGAGSAETVGGLLAGQGCTFINGQYGITSIKRDINVQGCTFNNIQVCGVNFTGASFVKRSLSIQNATFNNDLQDVFAEQRSNLTVKASSFLNTGGSAIRWYDNPDCDLVVGQVGSTPADIAQGNIFKGCGYGVLCYGNKSNGTSGLLYGGGQVGNGIQYTDIAIANNSMYGVVGRNMQLGISLYEYTLGGNVAYHTCEISRNFMSLVQSGIECMNVEGWAIFFNNINSTTNVDFVTKVENNTIGITTQYSPFARGITLKNSPGTNVVANGISSNAAYTWQNYGVYLENSWLTNLEGNAIQAGTGIVIALNETNSNVHCNSLSGNSCGINLAYAALRPQNVFHGFQYPNGNWKSYNNYFTGPSIPWGIDFQNYFSQNDQNKWVWDQIATSTFPKVWNVSTSSFEVNKTANSVISPYPYQGNQPVIGADSCSNSPVYGGNIFDVPFAGGANIGQTLSDPVAQWVADYQYQVQKNNTGQGNNSQASQQIKRIIRIEDAISQGQFSLANAQMNGFNPTNTIEQNYKDYLSVIIAVRNPIRPATPAEKSTLIAIAQQNPRVGGFAVYLARAYLFYSDYMTFADEDYTGPKVTGTAYIQSPCCLTPASGTTLTFSDQLGNELPITGAMVYQDGSFAFDPFQLQYYSNQNPTTFYRIVEKKPSTFTSLSRDFMTLADWIAGSPVTVLLGGAYLDTTIVTPAPDTIISRVTSMQDLSGNTYSISTVTLQSSDFLVQKFDPSSQLVWSRTFDGDSAGNDSAMCMTVDAEGSVYVAGKVWNGNHYDFQAVKYDSAGFIQWASLLNDTLNRNNEPTGIGVNPTDQCVYVVGKCCDPQHTNYRKAKYKQCITPTANRIAPPQQVETPALTFISYYPNPSDGTLNIDLKNGSGGLLELYNMNGQLVFTKQITESCQVSMPLELVPDGIYLLKFTCTSANPQIGKVVIHRN